MIVTLDSLTQDALTLPEDQRLALAHRLWASVEADADPGAEAAWEEEIARRIAALDAGTAVTVSWEEASARLRKIAPDPA